MVQLRQTLGCPYVDPAAGVTFPGQFPGGDGGIEQRAQFHDRPWFYPSEESRSEDCDTAVGEGLLTVGINDAGAVEAEIATVVVSRVGDHDQMGICGRLQKTTEINIAIDVTIDHQKRLVTQQGQVGGEI